MDWEKEILNAIAPGTSFAKERIAQAFEAQHKIQLFFLWQAGNYLQNSLEYIKNNRSTITATQEKAYENYLKKVNDLWKKWVLRNNRIESVTKQRFNIKPGDLFTRAGLDKIKMLLNQNTTEQISGGIGFIPLIIGAGVAALAIWGIYKIVDEMNTTTQEKKELMLATQNTCKDLNLSPDVCGKLISDTQAQASSGTGIGDLLKYGIFAFLGITAVNLFTSHKKSAA